MTAAINVFGAKIANVTRWNLVTNPMFLLIFTLLHPAQLHDAEPGCIRPSNTDLLKLKSEILDISCKRQLKAP